MAAAAAAGARLRPRPAPLQRTRKPLGPNGSTTSFERLACALTNVTPAGTAPAAPAPPHGPPGPGPGPPGARWPPGPPRARALRGPAARAAGDLAPAGPPGGGRWSLRFGMRPAGAPPGARPAPGGLRAPQGGKAAPPRGAAGRRVGLAGDGQHINRYAALDRNPRPSAGPARQSGAGRSRRSGDFACRRGLWGARQSSAGPLRPRSPPARRERNPPARLASGFALLRRPSLGWGPGPPCRRCGAAPFGRAGWRPALLQHPPPRGQRPGCRLGPGRPGGRPGLAAIRPVPPSRW